MRIIAISDVHLRSSLENLSLPTGDVLVIAGDLLSYGRIYELIVVSKDIKVIKNKYKHVLYIAGNHDIVLQTDTSLAKAIISENCQYIEDTSIMIDGLKFWGSPWTPIFFNWAFMKDSEGLKKIFRDIHNDVDVLITHGPAYGYLDQITPESEHLGSRELFDCVKRVNPLVHIYGHIHGGFGHLKQSFKKGDITFCNVSICDELYQPVNKPTIIDIENKVVNVSY